MKKTNQNEDKFNGLWMREKKLTPHPFFLLLLPPFRQRMSHQPSEGNRKLLRKNIDSHRLIVHPIIDIIDIIDSIKDEQHYFHQRDRWSSGGVHSGQSTTIRLIKKTGAQQVAKPVASVPFGLSSGGDQVVSLQYQCLALELNRSPCHPLHIRIINQIITADLFTLLKRQVVVMNDTFVRENLEQMSSHDNLEWFQQCTFSFQTVLSIS